MTSRVSRLFQPGQQRPRVFLPDFWMKLLETPTVGLERLPAYAALFEVDPRMSRLDVREYLTKIYKLPVRDVRIRMVLGEIEWSHPKDLVFRKALWKEEDRKHAYVYFRTDFVAKFADLFRKVDDDGEADVESARKALQASPAHQNEAFVNRDRAGVGRLLP